MQYALIALGEDRILVDACEVSVLNAWREHPVTDRDDFDEEAHAFHVCYGGYLLNPATPAADIHEKLAQQANHWLSAVTTGESACRQIGLCALRTFPLITAGHQNIVPFAALIKRGSAQKAAHRKHQGAPALNRRALRYSIVAGPPSRWKA